MDNDLKIKEKNSNEKCKQAICVCVNEYMTHALFMLLLATHRQTYIIRLIILTQDHYQITA